MMSLTLNVNHGQQISACTLNDSRVKRMMSGNHDTAVHMGLWDRFKDWFRIEKKAEALENLYKLLYPTPEDTEVSGLPGAVDNNEGKKYTSSLYAFRKLKALISDQSVSKSVNWTISLDVNNCLKTTFHFGNMVIEHQAIQLSSTGERPDLRGADLRGANLSGASLSGASLSGASLRGTNLSFARLHGADLRDASLYSTDLRSADLCDADLRSADLSFADLHNARLHGANLRNTNMHCVRLYGADLSFAIV
ncbi:pentapeptide repeat-containing protein [Escherichia fergusonii]|nr:pentapeptide repeat-containing protein [Escherichia fergusonii]EJB0947695.1 pentapeptide repeat-containing protein [Escherichia fergusonii]